VGAAQTISMTGAVYVGLPVTAHNNTNLCTAGFDNVWSTAPIASWQHQDVGSVGLAGSANNSTGLFTVTGAGGDIWGTADGLNYAFLPVTNNCTIVARVTSVQGVNAWSKAGLMIRESLNANSANAFIAVTPSNGVTFQYRSSTGGTSANTTTAALVAPYLVKLVRSGTTFTGSRSADGVNWTQQGTATITMAPVVYAGLAITSHDTSTACTAVFDNVSVPGWTNLSAPSAPTGLIGTAGDGKAALTWIAPSGATSYNLKRAATDGGPYAIVQNVATTNYDDLSLTNGSIYYYVVSGLNGGGESSNSVQVAVMPIPSMSLTQTGTDLTLSWSLASAGFRLQSRTNLFLGNWEDVTLPAPEMVGNQWQVTVPVSDGESVFYRLTK
jgi:hypothetical protein